MGTASGTSGEDLRETAGRCAVLIRRAVLTIRALPDNERRWLGGPRSPAPDPIRSLAESYDSEAARAETARAARFRPSPADVSRCLEVLSWLTWLGRRNDGRRDVAIITARAFGTPFWKLARRYGRSDETIRRWEAGAIAAIALTFRDAIGRMGPP